MNKQEAGISFLLLTAIFLRLNVIEKLTPVPSMPTETFINILAQDTSERPEFSLAQEPGSHSSLTLILILLAALVLLNLDSAFCQDSILVRKFSPTHTVNHINWPNISQ